MYDDNKILEAFGKLEDQRQALADAEEAAEELVRSEMARIEDDFFGLYATREEAHKAVREAHNKVHDLERQHAAKYGEIQDALVFGDEGKITALRDEMGSIGKQITAAKGQLTKATNAADEVEFDEAEEARLAAKRLRELAQLLSLLDADAPVMPERRIEKRVGKISGHRPNGLVPNTVMEFRKRYADRDPITKGERSPKQARERRQALRDDFGAASKAMAAIRDELAA